MKFQMFPSIRCSLFVFEIHYGYRNSVCTYCFNDNRNFKSETLGLWYAMSTPPANINEINSNSPSRVPAEPDSPPVYWPGLEEMSSDSEGFAARQNEAVSYVGEDAQPNRVLNSARRPVRRRELTSEERLEVVQLLLKKSVNGVLPRTATGDVAYQFGVGIRSIQRVWKRAQDSGNNAYQNNRVRNCGRKRVQFDLERMRSIPLSKRTTIRSLAYALGVSKSFLYNKLKEGVIRRHSNAIKPSLTAENHMERVNHVLSSFEPSSVPHDPTFSRMANTVHIDEKWFYLTKKCQTYYLLQDEIEPVRTIKSSHFIPKVMFLAAVARLRYDSDGLCTFDGKIGIFPLIQSVAAVRSSQNRPRGTVEIKPIANITREVIREFMVNKLLPAIACRWPGESISEAIYIQQDNAKTHIHTDDIDFLCAVEESGMNVSLVCQPPNSPDLNVLDLGFFRAIQSLQNKECAKSIVELIGAVEHAYQEFSDKKSNKVFLTLQSCMLEILKCDGNNNYKIPHIGKDHLDRQGTLPSVLHCSPELYANAVAYMT